MSLCDKCIHRLPCGNENDFVQNCEFYEEPMPIGYWIPQDEFSAYYKCSICGMLIDNDFPIWRNFCPRCGSRLKEGIKND